MYPRRTMNACINQHLYQADMSIRGSHRFVHRCGWEAPPTLTAEPAGNGRTRSRRVTWRRLSSLCSTCGRLRWDLRNFLLRSSVSVLELAKSDLAVVLCAYVSFYFNVYEEEERSEFASKAATFSHFFDCYLPCTVFLRICMCPYAEDSDRVKL